MQGQDRSSVHTYSSRRGIREYVCKIGPQCIHIPLCLCDLSFHLLTYNYAHIYIFLYASVICLFTYLHICSFLARREKQTLGISIPSPVLLSGLANRPIKCQQNGITAYLPVAANLNLGQITTPVLFSNSNPT